MSSVGPFQPGVAPAAGLAWVQLAALLSEVGPVPCASEPERWTPRADRTVMAGPDVEHATEGCARCPLVVSCREYADLARERHGVWGGVDRTPRPGRSVVEQTEVRTA